jgi:uncharacterized membrane protein
MQLPSIDIFIGLAFLVGIAYSFILKRDKTITILCSVYVGLVISSAFAQSVFNFFNGNSTIGNQIWIRSNASLSTISIVLFLVCIVFVSGAVNSSASRSGDISPIEVFVYSCFTMGLIISTVLSFLPPATSQHFLDVSMAARLLKNYRTLLVVGAPLMIILLNLRKK